MEDFYATAGAIAAFLAFWATMVWAVFTWGVLLGLAVGWIPALFIAAAARYLWPLAVIGLIVVLVYLVT